MSCHRAVHRSCAAHGADPGRGANHEIRCFANRRQGAPHARVSGDDGTNRDRLIDFINAQGIELEFNERIAPAMGMSYGGKIVLLPGQSKAEEFSCLVHELGHELVHKSERRSTTTKTIRETEAEAIAFVVSKAIRTRNWNRRG